ncbi:PAS domain S-box protein [Methanocella sp. MCL-LM]|uniref:PAS domain-containing protein n=1 Tax=Methanocella sp. MCL-LM TaxID=3412035 RepID=UPI003C7361A4
MNNEQQNIAEISLSSIVDFSDDAIISKNLQDIITSWNMGATDLYGYTEREALGMPISILLPPDQPGEDPLLEKIRNGERIQHYETIRMRKDGRRIIVSLSLFPMKDEKGDVIGVSSIARDVTDRIRAEESVRLISDYNRSLIEASLDPLVTISLDGKITDVNKATETVTGYDRRILIGTDFSNYFTDPGKAREGYLRVFEEGIVKDYPLEIRHTDGHVTPVIYNATVYKDKLGKVIGVFAAARDITERKKAEEELRLVNSELEKRVQLRTQELSDSNTALREEIAERRRVEAELKKSKAQAELYLDLMCHDINNMHQIALGYIELAMDMNGNAGGLFLDRPLEVLQRSANLIDNVRKLQKLQTSVLHRETIDLARLISEIGREYESLSGDRVKLVFAKEEKYTVLANELLYDVFSNLVSNSIKHSAGNASVTLAMSKTTKEKTRFCRVAVEDNGPGVPDELKETVFNRLLRGTTKAKGMGLGLYLVKSLVESYHGQVWVEDRVQGDYTKGSRFIVLIPAVDV